MTGQLFQVGQPVWVNSKAFGLRWPAVVTHCRFGSFWRLKNQRIEECFGYWVTPMPEEAMEVDCFFESALSPRDQDGPSGMSFDEIVNGIKDLEPIL